MLKDNHIAINKGDIRSAINLVKSIGDFASKIETECASFKEAQMAIQAGADIVMLDNLDSNVSYNWSYKLFNSFFLIFSIQNLIETAKRLKEQNSHILIEASGGINENNIDSYASPFVDIISMSQLTQAYVPIDFSMKVSSIITKE